MVTLTSAKITKPNPKKSYHISGIEVEFPYQPYGAQLAFMGRVISTLDRAQKDGHCHALLESPTGTGKSLSLLCSTLAWQQNYKLKNQYANLTHSKSNPEAIPHPLAYGGGFIPESQPSNIEPTRDVEPAQEVASNKKKKAAPVIYYSSRTHSQISQVIREFRKTAYRVLMAVLASRKHYCTNEYVNGKENIDEECKLLLMDKEIGCQQFKNVNKVKGHPSLQKGGCHEVHDIEDLVKVGQVVKGCPYYAARDMADDAQLVFCPYSYIVNPVIRGAMDVQIEGAILVFDEAHNIEDIARVAGSVDVEEDILHKLQMELQTLCPGDPMIYRPLYEMAQDLISWMERKKNKLEKREFQNHFSCWTGDRALKELQEANISQQCFPILLECCTKAIKAAKDTEEAEDSHLSGMSVITLEGLFSSLTYFFSRNGCHVSDFQLALRRYVKRDGRNVVGDWTYTFSLWCLNPAVVFRDIADLSLSVILTSGTLSPMNSFSSELGVEFGTCLEAPHVVDVESQVWVSVISTSPDNYPLNASYKTADSYTFQDALGKSLEEICKIVPFGSLVFFPSYKLMEKLCNRWRETGQWSRLNARKSLFVEPRGGSQEDFDFVLKSYYDCIRQGKKPAPGRKRKVKKLDVDHFNGTESTVYSKKDGAAFLAVCRGKVSEGIDFSDDNARVVIVVGIPFPNINDTQVDLKKKYNDKYKTTKNLISGNEWYCHQAFRALNQAVGRCIRHRFDYGAVILLDERYKEERNRVYISKWLRNSIRQYDSFDMSVEGLRSFFKNAKEKVGESMVNLGPNFDANKETNIHHKDQIKGNPRNKGQKLSKFDRYGEEIVPLTKCDAAALKVKSRDDVELKASQIDDDMESKEIIDLQSDAQEDSRFSEASSHEDPEMTFVKESPSLGDSGTTGSPGSFSKDVNSNSTMIQAPTVITYQGLVSAVSVANQRTPPDKAQCSMAVTPKKELTISTDNLITEVDSSLNLSVNSHTQKRRKSMGVSSINLMEEQSDVPDAQTPGCLSFTGSSVTSGDINCRIEFGLETNRTRSQFTKSNAPPLLPNTCFTSCASSDSLMDKRLRISCSLCKNPLGLPDNDLCVGCSLTSSSKVHVVSLVKQRLEHCAENTSTCIPVLLTDISSVDQRLCNSTLEDSQCKGVWCEEDGCVFKSLFCPFCSTSNCLGVQIVATDASNVKLLNKILLYIDRLEIQDTKASNETTPRVKDSLPVTGCSSIDRTAILNSLDRFKYSPQQNSRGWRTTKSKLSLPKRGMFSNTQG